MNDKEKTDRSDEDRRSELSDGLNCKTNYVIQSRYTDRGLWGDVEQWPDQQKAEYEMAWRVEAEGEEFQYRIIKRTVTETAV